MLLKLAVQVESSCLLQALITLVLQ